MNRKMKRLGILAVVILVGCNAMPTPILPPDGLQLVIGDKFAEKTRNGARNLTERRALLINALVARR